MNADRLLGHYERIADAPDAVQRLRRFILDLAVRGKLVEQDPADEPASELLKRIAEEKARLVKAREIRKGKSLPVIGLDEFPFETPCSWEWVRIRNVMSDRGQTIPDRDFTYIDVTAINKEVGCIDNTKVISASKAPSRARKIVRMGDVLYSSVRPYLLNIAIVESEISPSPIASTAFAVLNGFGLVLPRYQWIVLRSPFMIAGVEDKMRGQAYPAINDSDFAILPFPLPPLAEQHRIVAKVDELMALCDRLEAARTERESTRDRLAAVSLIRLNDPDPDPVVFRNHAAFALENLAPLTTRTDQIKALRQTILNLAVRGKLVEQDPNDEPASELLRRLRANTDGKARRKARDSEDINADEVPFECPEGWMWTKVQQTLNPDREISYGVIKLGDEPKFGGIPTLRCSDVRAGFIDLLGVRKVDEAIESEYARTRLLGGDVVINIRGTLGGVALVPHALKGFNVAREVAVVPIANEISGPFVVYLMLSPYFWDHIQNNLRGIAYKGLNLGILRELPIPLPPLAEQHRIVAKVDELMALCDRLDVILATDDDTRLRLLDALLHEALPARLGSWA